MSAFITSYSIFKVDHAPHMCRHDDTKEGREGGKEGERNVREREVLKKRVEKEKGKEREREKGMKRGKERGGKDARKKKGRVREGRGGDRTRRNEEKEGVKEGETEGEWSLTTDIKNIPLT